MRLVLLTLSLLSAACTNDLKDSESFFMNPSDSFMLNLAFSCAHEVIPAPSTEAEIVFKYARWLQKGNQLKQDRVIDADIERLYRVAAENGHFKANINLQNGSLRSRFNLNGSEHLRLSNQLIEAGVATGYYFVSSFLRDGTAGLKQDQELALRYLRKAADEGSALAQVYVADKLAPKNIAPEISRQMRRCAAEQGNGKAATALGVNMSTLGRHQEAIEAYQLGVKAGDSSSASFLANGFRGPAPDDRLYYLGQHQDLERAARYAKIRQILSGYSYANPVVPEINDIVPLPPAELPEWDGKLQWLEARLANIPPEKPGEALITQLANAKKLDPATGKPLPGSPAFSQANFPVRIRYTGEACPQSGYWKVIWPPVRAVQKVVIQHFEQGDIFPLQAVERYHIRPWPLFDKTSRRDEVVKWGLLG
ncbi:DUF6396 domain-containing protein [Pseudomonas silvicola]|nr:DUF6396 domain-containing protein [Pseudomonas silvicola]